MPIIGISAHVQEAEIAAAFDAGMTEMLAKPLSPEQLGAALRRIAEKQPSSNVLAVVLGDIGPAKTRDVAAMFLDQLQSEAAAIDMAMAAADMPSLRRCAHRLKGAAGNFDLPEMVETLHRIERAAGAGDAKAASGEVAALRSQIGPTQTRVQQALAQIGHAA